jgi:predicted secreted protein
VVKLDQKSIVWGVLISAVVNGLYETLKALFEGNTGEETVTFVSTVVVAAVVILAFWKVLTKEDEETE